MTDDEIKALRSIWGTPEFASLLGPGMQNIYDTPAYYEFMALVHAPLLEPKQNEPLTINHALLLGKYMDYVTQVEGTSYILIHDERWRTDAQFSEGEWAELQRLARSNKEHR